MICVGKGFYLGNGGFALGEGACFVENDIGYPVSQFQGLRIFDEYAQFCAFADAHHERSGGCQSECARTGDDEYVDECGEGKSLWGIEWEEVPEQGGGEGEGQNGWNEDGGDSIGQFLDLGFGSQGLFHARHDLR